MQEFVDPLAELGEKVAKLTAEIGLKAFGNADEVGAAATDYLRIVGHLVFAWLWARMARFYFARLLPETAALMRSVRAGAPSMMALDEALF
jgi:hypothetical protein